jgi:hypothetical protein
MVHSESKSIPFGSSPLAWRFSWPLGSSQLRALLGRRVTRPSVGTSSSPQWVLHAGRPPFNFDEIVIDGVRLQTSESGLHGKRSKMAELTRFQQLRPVQKISGERLAGECGSR